MSTGHILIYAGNEASAVAYRRSLERYGYQAAIAGTPESVFEALQRGAIDVCLVEISTRQFDGTVLTRLLAESIACSLPTQFLLLTSDDLQVARDVQSASRVDVIHRTVSDSQLHALLASAVKRSHLQAENDGLRSRLHGRILKDIIGQSAGMHRLRTQIHDVALRETSVVIRGEAGSGVTLCTRAVHAARRRAPGRLFHIDCRIQSAGALRRELETGKPEFGVRSSELGIRNSALRAPSSALRETLVLDHIDSATLAVQDVVTSYLNDAPDGVQIVAGTKADLDELTQRGEFRRELRRCLGEDVIVVPPLRSRREDIGPLADFFLSQTAQRIGETPQRLSLDALEFLENHAWPGNVAELQNVIQGVCSVETGEWLGAAEFHPWMNSTPSLRAAIPDGNSLRSIERKLIEATFNRCRGNREKTAKELQIGLRTLSGKLREYGYPPRGGPGSNVRLERRRAA